MKLKYEAPDGRQFDTPELCRSYELANPELLLIGMTLDQIRAAMRREDSDLADALEKVGTGIARDRRADGEFKRQPKPTASPPTLAIAGPRTDAEPEPASAISTGGDRTNPDDETEAEARAA